MDTLRGALECVDLATGALHRPEHVEALIEQVAGRVESLGRKLRCIAHPHRRRIKHLYARSDAPAPEFGQNSGDYRRSWVKESHVDVMELVRCSQIGRDI